MPSLSPRIIAGKRLNPIGLGCMSLSHGYYPRPDKQQSLKVLNHAIDIGYTHFDSARLYGLGENEALLSDITKTRRSEMFITSKCGIEFDDGQRRIDCRPETIRKAVDKSLKTLNVDYIDLYYLHRRDFDTPIEESVGALADMKAAGKIGAIGLSEMSSTTLRKAHAETLIAAMQTEYSLWTRNPEISVLETCKELGTAFIAFSPLARGVFAGAIQDPQTLHENDLRLKQPRFNSENWPANLELVNHFNALVQSIGITPAQLSLAWVLSRSEHVHVIPGTASIQHLEENIEVLNVDIPDEAFVRAGEIVNHQTVQGHRYPDAMRKAIDTEDF